MKEGIKEWFGRLEKLNRLILWVKETIDDKIIIGANILTDVYTWIYSAYTVHSAMRSHTGGSISMVHGVLRENVLVQRLDTKSSTEAELVSVSEYLPCDLWLMYFCMVRDI